MLEWLDNVIKSFKQAVHYYNFVDGVVARCLERGGAPINLAGGERSVAGRNRQGARAQAGP